MTEVEASVGGARDGDRSASAEGARDSARSASAGGAPAASGRCTPTGRAVQVAGAVFGTIVFGRWAAGRLRSWQLTWGASAHEAAAQLPGDGFVPSADLVATRAISIAAPPEQVWPWIAQLGQQRGGFYSYDRLENLVGCRIHSADEVVEAWQDVHVGDALHLHPEVALEVARVEPGRALVVRGAVPVAGALSRTVATDLNAAPAAPPAAPPPTPPYDFSWAFVLRPEQGGTRLLVRERYGYLRPSAAALVEPVALVSFVMTQRMLRGIRDRVEAR